MVKILKVSVVGGKDISSRFFQNFTVSSSLCYFSRQGSRTSTNRLLPVVTTIEIGKRAKLSRKHEIKMKRVSSELSQSPRRLKHGNGVWGWFSFFFFWVNVEEKIKICLCILLGFDMRISELPSELLEAITLGEKWKYQAAKKKENILLTIKQYGKYYQPWFKYKYIIHLSWNFSYYSYCFQCKSSGMYKSFYDFVPCCVVVFISLQLQLLTICLLQFVII